MSLTVIKKFKFKNEMLTEKFNFSLFFCLFCLWATSRHAQELLLALHSGITYSLWIPGTIWDAVIEPGLAMRKARATPAML